MSRYVKWLIILVLVLLIHIVYAVAASAPGPQDSYTRVFPFGDLRPGMVGSFVFPELLVAALIVIVLACIPWSHTK